MTPNFSDEELTCKCGCGMLPSLQFMERVQKLRERVGFPLIVSSAARCPEYNAKVSSTGRTGPHTTGHAIDLVVSHAHAFLVVDAALAAMYFNGIGISQKGDPSKRFIHLDDLPDAPGQPRPTIWSY